MRLGQSIRRMEISFNGTSKPKKKNNPSDEDKIAKLISSEIIGFGEKQN